MAVPAPTPRRLQGSVTAVRHQQGHELRLEDYEKGHSSYRNEGISSSGDRFLPDIRRNTGSSASRPPDLPALASPAVRSILSFLTALSLFQVQDTVGQKKSTTIGAQERRRSTRSQNSCGTSYHSRGQKTMAGDEGRLSSVSRHLSSKKLRISVYQTPAATSGNQVLTVPAIMLSCMPPANEAR